MVVKDRVVCALRMQDIWGLQRLVRAGLEESVVSLRARAAGRGSWQQEGVQMVLGLFPCGCLVAKPRLEGRRTQ